MKALLYVVTFMTTMLFARDVWALTTAQKIQILYPSISDSNKTALSGVFDSCSGSYSIFQDGVTVTFTAIRDINSCNFNVDSTGPNGSLSGEWTFFDNGAIEGSWAGIIIYMEELANGNLYVETNYGEGITEAGEYTYECGEWIKAYDSKDDDKKPTPTPQTTTIKR